MKGIPAVIFQMILMRNINNVPLNILFYYKPWPTAQTQSLPLSDRVEPVAAMATYPFFGFNIEDVARSFSQMKFHEFRILDLAQKAYALTVFAILGWQIQLIG